MKTALYLYNEEKHHRRWIWFKNTKPNEMLFGLYGINKKNATLKYIFPDQVVPADDISINYKYAEAEQCDILIDHITCHIDGRFHIRTKNHEDFYIHSMKRTEPLSADTPTFLDFILLTQSEGLSPSSESIPDPSIGISVSQNQQIYIRGMFSGSNYDVVTDLVSIIKNIPCNFTINNFASDTLQGALASNTTSINPEVKKSSQTILSFRFPVGANEWRLKTFVFE